MTEAGELAPIAETEDTVTLRRGDYEALLEVLEDAADIAVPHAAEAAVQRGSGELLPLEMAERLLAGGNPVRVWRSHRGMTEQQLAEAAGLAPGDVSEIERGKKPASFDAMARLARALKVAMQDLAPSRRNASA